MAKDNITQPYVTHGNNKENQPNFTQAKDEAYRIEKLKKELEEQGQEIQVLTFSEPNKTDIGNAERFKHYVGDDCRYCAPFKKWYIWDGKRWFEDQKNEIISKAKIVCKSIYAAASLLDDEKKRKEMAHYALETEHISRIRAMIEIAKSELPILPEELDSIPHFFNVQNGILNLESDEFIEHDRNYFITKISNANYNQAAQCPLWLQVLDKIMNGNQDLIDFIQKAVALSLIGRQLEHVIFILYGLGANCKSTFLNTLLYLFNDYGLKTPTETLMIKKGDIIPNDVARLRSARFVSAIETQSGRTLNEGLIKQLTGNDVVVARFLHAEFFEFRPEFTLFLATNHKPTIRGTDLAIWRRIRLIPFEVTIPEDEQDPFLYVRLKNEVDGILNWCLEGLQKYRKDGLKMSETVKKATNEYRNEMDVIGDFLDEVCSFSNNGDGVKSSALYNAYKEWAEKNGEYIISQRVFSLRMQERNHVFCKERDGRYWKGINLNV